jgi:hypothetical protein
MGWSSGSALMSDVLHATLRHIPTRKHAKVVGELIDAFESLDADTLDECSDDFPVVREVLRKRDPEMYDD